MSAVLEINEETAEVLTNRAKAEGQSVDEYVKSLLSQNEKPIAPQKATDAESRLIWRLLPKVLNIYGLTLARTPARTSILIMTDGVPNISCR